MEEEWFGLFPSCERCILSFNRSEYMKTRWADPVFKAKQSATLQGHPSKRWSCPEGCQCGKHTLVNTGQFQKGCSGAPQYHTVDGVTHTIKEWAVELRLKEGTLRRRMWRFGGDISQSVRKLPVAWADTDLKRCPKCGQDKPILGFNKRGVLSRGLVTSWCLACTSIKVRAKLHQKRLQVIDHYTTGARVCGVCGFDDVRALDVDHIDGFVGKREPSNTLIRRLVREGFPAGYRILCRNCNWLEWLKRRDSRP